MQFKLSGEVIVSAPIVKVSALINDPSQVSSCIPDSRDFRKTDEKSFSVTTDLSLGAVSGSLAIRVEIEKQDQENVKYTITGSGLGSRAKIILKTSLSAKEDKTGISWEADAEFRGIVSGIGEQIIKNVTNEKVNGIIANMKEKLEAG